jgi:hypothetical protein
VSIYWQFDTKPCRRLLGVSPVPTTTIQITLDRASHLYLVTINTFTCAGYNVDQQISLILKRLSPVVGSSSALRSTPPSCLQPHSLVFYCPLYLHPHRRAKLESRRVRGSFLRLRLDIHTQTNVSLSSRRGVGRLDWGSNPIFGYNLTTVK